MASFREGPEYLAERSENQPAAASIVAAEHVRGAVPFALHPLEPFALDSVSRESGHSNASSSSDTLDLQLQERYRQGFEEGRASAERALEQRQQEQWRTLGASVAQRIDAIATTVNLELDAQQQLLADRLLELALVMAQRIVAREISIDRTGVRSIVEHCMTLIPSPAGPLSLRLNPDDAAALNEAGHDFGERAITVVADGSIAPGGCRLSGAHADIDATLPTRWGELIDGMGMGKIARTDQ